jgi:ribosome maturation factor RimP
MKGRHGQVDGELERLVEAVLERLGFELVELEKAGHRSRPILRVRIDRRGSEVGGVTVDECARASRELEPELDEREDLPGGYILEVSSPGVERPLRLRRDFERAVGREIEVRGNESLVGGSKRVEGELLGVEGSEDSERLRLRLANGREVDISLSAVAKANLVFKWDDFDFGKSQEKRA